MDAPIDSPESTAHPIHALPYTPLPEALPDDQIPVQPPTDWSALYRKLPRTKDRENFATWSVEELRVHRERQGHTEERITAELAYLARDGRLKDSPLFGVGAPEEAERSIEPRPLAFDIAKNPPVERFLLGRLAPLAKSTVLFGPTGAGKSAWLAQLVFAVAGGAKKLHGLAVGVHGPVLVVSAEDSYEDWQRKAAAIHHATDLDVELGHADVHIMDLTDGEARLSEVVSLRDRSGVGRRESRATRLADKIIERALVLGVVLVVIETASRLVEDEDNASFSALQSALGRIARQTGAAVIVTHHATKAASKENDNSIENARGGGSLIYNARNAIALFPADASTARAYADRFAASDLFELHHGKSTSSTKREDAIVLVRGGTPYGAVFHLPDDVEADARQADALKARAEASRALAFDRMRRLYTLVADILQTRGRVTASHLESRNGDLGISRKEMRALVERAMREGFLKRGERVNSGFSIVLGVDPNRPISESISPEGGQP